MNLYQFAQETERSGIEFYRTMAKQARDEGISRIFSMMAADEEKLLQKWDNFRQHYPEVGTMECSFLHPKTIPFDSICNNGRCSRIATDLDAYQLAMDAEERIVNRYLDAAEQEQDPRVKQMLGWMAAMEKHELRQIEQLYDFVDAPNRSLEWGEFSNLEEFHNFGYYEDLREGKLES
jgi:rubrerythrin